MVSEVNENTPDMARFRRSPDNVMRLARMGSFHQTRLSFMRSLLRRLKRENWTFDRAVWDVNSNGVGRAVYTAQGPRRSYSLVAFAHDLPAEKRSDRVIAEAWDATFCLFDGVPTDEDLDRLQANVPLQEAGRISDSEVSLSRANRSVRLWDHVVDRLAAGQQPDKEKIDNVGYLMRTTAVYGSGKFGAADRAVVQDRVIMGGPFHVEMLSVFLTRAFVMDLVEHIALAKGGDKAVPLDPTIRRSFGIGNSTGLGMAPFLINHPALLNSWIAAREEALARVRALETAAPEKREVFMHFLERSVENAKAWHSAHPLQIDKIAALNADLEKLTDHVSSNQMNGNHPWDAIYKWGEDNLSLEGQEQLVGLIIEPYGDLVDDLAGDMAVDEDACHRIDGAMSVGAFKKLITQHYSWALNVDYSDKANSAFYWYVSEEKLEPRLGDRYTEPNTAYEQPLCVGRDAKDLHDTLTSWADDSLLADVLLQHPEYRHVARRVQIVGHRPYAEIRDNLIGADLLPIDILRCKLSFFGATHFDPRSDRWVRICMYQNAPFPDELANMDADDWTYPSLEQM